MRTQPQPSAAPLTSDRRLDEQIEARAANLRVAFFSDAYPERNGTGAYYHDLLAQLADRIEAVEVFQPLADGPRPMLSMAMPGDPQQRLVTPPLRAIRRACDELRPEVVVVVTPGLYGLLGVWEARRSGARLVAAFHTDFEQLAKIYWNPLARFFAGLVLRTANRIICSRSASVLINNEGLRNDVENLGAQRVDVIGTPLPLTFLRQQRRPMPLRLQRVCFAGRLAPEKNVDRIVEAARELPAVDFVVVGDGPLRAQLERQGRDLRNLHFLGWLDREALIDVIDSASLLLLPSSFETFGSVALEAMARGRPALVSRRAGIQAWPMLQKGLFILEDPAVLSGTLASLLKLEDSAWRSRGAQAQAAAEAFNNHTLLHWLELLAKYRPAPGNGS